MIAFQFFLSLFHGAAYFIDLPRRMVLQIMTDDLDIQDVLDCHRLYAICRLQHHLLFLMPPHIAHCLFHLEGKLLIAQRLDDIIDRLDLVAMQSILCHIGNKHKQDFLVILSDPARQRNAVHARHFHIQKDQVCILLIMLQKILRTFIDLCDHADLLLFFKSFQIISDLIPHLFFIIYYDYSHTFLPFLTL